ncbi:hypothetical protein LINPERPRIM_LOCUS35792 [Linum perenne]
MNLLC